jgi:hypothetical protein
VEEAFAEIKSSGGPQEEGSKRKAKAGGVPDCEVAKKITNTKMVFRGRLPDGRYGSNRFNELPAQQE